MATSSKPYSHVRSNSLPSNPHPVISQIDEHLCWLRASDTCSSSSSSTVHKLSALLDLYDSIDTLLQLPSTHQALLQTRDAKCVAAVLEGSVRILDLCDIARNSLVQSQESARQLQSVLRRKRSESEIVEEVKKCMATRKMTKKLIQKALGGTRISKQTEENQDETTLTVVDILRKVEAVSMDTFESTLCFVSGPKNPSKPTLTSLFSKRVTNHDDKAIRSESETLNESLMAMMRSKANKSEFQRQSENVRNSLTKLDSAMEQVEDNVENLQRRLVRTRASLLNIFSN